MPRSGRGGRRSGTPGKAYANRSDLTGKATAAPTYGDKAAAQASLQAVPMASGASGGGAPPVVPTGPPPPVPGALPFNRPSDRPNEPLTAGLPIGAGPGPGVMAPAVDPVIETLRAAARTSPNPAVFDLLEFMESRG